MFEVLQHLKASANEETLLETSSWKHFPETFPRLRAHATFVAELKFASREAKMFLNVFRNILLPRQLFPRLRAAETINVD